MYGAGYTIVMKQEAMLLFTVPQGGSQIHNISATPPHAISLGACTAAG